MKPVWFLDIDGVINAFFGETPEGYLTTVASAHDADWEITYSPEVIDFINRVHRGGLAEIRWLTTWEQYARTSLAPAVGLDDFSAYDDPGEDGSPMSWWKGQIVTDFVLDEARPFVWTDDDIDAETAAMFEAESVPNLIGAPSPSTGLTPDHLKQIHDFLISHTHPEGTPS